MNGISDAQWGVYKNIINNAHNFFNQDEITWVRDNRGLQRYGEDDGNLKNTDTITLKCLINYNVYRSWPMTKESESGTIDKESIAVLFNKKYLNDLGYINANGKWRNTCSSG